MNSEAFPAFLTQNKTNMLFSSGLNRFKQLIDLDTYCYNWKSFIGKHVCILKPKGILLFSLGHI